MKVIDLLNKIANGEPLPNKICLECVNSINEHNCYYHFSPIFESYINDDNTLIQNATNLATLLNLEVEIIEEDNKIPTLKNLNLTKIDINKRGQVYGVTTKEVVADIQTLQNWINKIIDYINKEK